MRGIQRVSDLNRQRNEQFVIQRQTTDAVLQHHAIEELHGDESLSILLSDVVNGANIGMIQGGRGLCLTLKASQCQRMAGNVLGQELESDETMQAGVFGLIDDSHTAAAKSFDDPVMRDYLTDHLARILRPGGGQVNERAG